MNLTHDDNGNLTYDPTASTWYQYDEENRVVMIDGAWASVYLFYDALGRRVDSYTYDYYTALEGWTRHVFSGLAVTQEYEGSIYEWVSLTLAREFVWGASFTEPVALIDRTAAGAVGVGTPEVLHYLTGALGSVVALTDAAGAVVERYDYDPYGKTYIQTAGGTARDRSAYGNPFLWTGQRYDAAVGLYHFWARTYSPELGRWLQRDPLGYVDGVSLYEYVASDPLGMMDPYGLFGWGDIWGTIKEGIGKVGGFIKKECREIKRAYKGSSSEKAYENQARPWQAVHSQKTLSEMSGARAFGEVAGLAAAPFVVIYGGPYALAAGRLLLQWNITTITTATGGVIRVTIHGLHQMQERGITPSVVWNAIQHGIQKAGNEPNTTVYVYENVTVVVNSITGVVITVIGTGH